MDSVHMTEGEIDGVKKPFDRVAMLDEAAKILGISKWTIKRQGNAGKIAILKLSPRRLGIRMSEIERYLSSSIKGARE
jgi:predicted site-specific integrase-resolvase